MYTILSVDDDPKILAAFEAALQHRGYRVFVTTHPAEVANILKTHRIDLVMLDVHMPEQNGFEIFRELKEKYTSLPVLFVTAYPHSFNIESSEFLEMWSKDFADGNTDILYKPFTLETLYEKVAGLIGTPQKEKEGDDRGSG